MMTVYVPTAEAQRAIAEQLGIDIADVVRMECSLDETAVRSIEIDTIIDGAFVSSTYLMM